MLIEIKTAFIIDDQVWCLENYSEPIFTKITDIKIIIDTDKSIKIYYSSMDFEDKPESMLFETKKEAYQYLANNCTV